MNGDRLYDVLRLVRPLHQHSAAAVELALADSDLSMPMRAIIERVHDDGPQTVPQIARALFITRQGVQRFVDEAKALGYLETRPNPEHRRSHLIAVTHAGRTAYEELHSAELARLDGFAADLDPQDIEACVRVLAHLTARVRALVDPAAPSLDKQEES